MRKILRRTSLICMLASVVCCVIIYIILVISKQQWNTPTNALVSPAQYKPSIVKRNGILTNQRENKIRVIDNADIKNREYLKRRQVFIGKEARRLEDSEQYISGAETLAHYCNSKDTLTSGSEGDIPDGFKLRQVHVFTRHGDRSAMGSLPGSTKQYLNCNFSSWYLGTDPDILRFPGVMEDMRKVTNRTGIFSRWTMYPKSDTCKMSSLTSRGALQHIYLGKHLKNAYSTKNSLIDKNKSFGDQLLVKSTLFGRTYQSAHAFLYGFLSTLNRTSSVDIKPSRSLYFCSTKPDNVASCACERAEVLKGTGQKEQFLQNEHSFVSFQLKQAIADIFGIDISSLTWIKPIADSLSPAFCNKLPPPCSVNNPRKCVDANLVGGIWLEIMTQEKSQSEQLFSTQMNLAGILLYPVMAEIAQRIQMLKQRKFTQSFVLYSGHDVTITALLYLLGLDDRAWPPYASRIVIETVESEVNAGDFYLRFIYNGKDITEQIIFCKDRQSLCSVGRYFKFVSDEMLQRFDHKSYTEACN